MGLRSTLLWWLNASKPVLAVVGAHAAVAHAAEGQVGREEVHERLVHAHPAAAGVVDDVVDDVVLAARTRRGRAAWGGRAMNALASVGPSTPSTGRIGPKISSCMTALSGRGLDGDGGRDVALGGVDLAAGRDRAGAAGRAGRWSRSRWRSLTMRPKLVLACGSAP